METSKSLGHSVQYAAETDERTMSWPYLRLLRPKHFIKNAFVLAPLLFSGSFLLPESIFQSVLAVVFFCVASAAVYIFNDLQDIDKDRLHPEKRHTRPLAAGAISAAQGRNVLFLLYTILIAWTLARPGVGVVIAGYVAVNVAYTLWLKHRPPLDLFCLSSGFLLRVYAGAKAIAVDLSSWMFVTTLCLALYLAATKRRQELMTHGSAARSVLKKYTPALLDSYAQTSAVGALVFYGLFAATVRPALAITIPAVLFGLFRYRYITEMKGDGESPTDALWSDPSLIVTCVVWALCSLYAVAQAPTTSVQVLHP